MWFLIAANTLNFYDRQLLGAVAEPLRIEMGWNDFQLGILSTAFTLLYALASLPMGRIADRCNRQSVLGIGLATWSLFTALCGFAWNFSSMLAFRLGTGMGEATCAPTATALVGEQFPESRRAGALSLFMLGLPLGSALSYSLGGWLTQSYGWRVAFFSAGIAGLLLALLGVSRSAKIGRKRSETGREPAQDPVVVAVRKMLKLPAFGWMIGSGAIHNFNLYAISAFLPAFLIRYHHVDVKTAGLMTGLAYAALGGTGILIGGYASDRFRLSASRSASRLWVAFGACLFSIPPFLLALSCAPGQLMLFAGSIAPAALLLYMYYPAVYAAIQDIVPGSSRGLAMAVYLTVMYLLGGSLGPAVVGWLSDRFREQGMRALPPGVSPELLWADGLHRAMYLIPFLTLFLAGTLALAAAASRKSGRHEPSEKS